jgi:3-isopropylmalate/(R)-2-methylmalate dehydratase small subunit
LNKKIKGKTWKFGDNISTDLMFPSSVMHHKVPDSERKWHCMEANRPEFARNVKENDIMVGGKNFGCGSSRPASELLVDLHVGCVIADSFSAIFYRNSVAEGLPVIELANAGDLFDEGDILEVDLESSTISNLTKERRYAFNPFPKEIVEILSSGGMIQYLKNESLQ